MKKIIGFISLAFVMIGTSCSSRGAESVPIETLTVTPIVEISALNPGLTKLPLWQINPFALDDYSNIYLLDTDGHRILKYNPKGVFLAQIGSIGQTKEGLFSPIGLCLEKDLLYILNRSGCEVKVFSTEGEFRSSFLIENAWTSNSICVIEDLIYVNVIEKKRPTENKRCLISVYSKNGRLVRTMGRIVESNSLGGYSVFNEIIPAVADSRLFWAFCNIPLISGEDLEGEGGRNSLDLRELGVPEVTARTERAKRLGFDSPETYKPDTDLRTQFSVYCHGFGVDQNKRMYYVIQEYPDGPGQGGRKCHLLVIGKSGKIEKKFIPQHEGGKLMISHLLFGPGDSRYGLGEIKGKTLLFKF